MTRSFNIKFQIETLREIIYHDRMYLEYLLLIFTVFILPLVSRKQNKNFMFQLYNQRQTFTKFDKKKCSGYNFIGKLNLNFEKEKL